MPPMICQFVMDHDDRTEILCNFVLQGISESSLLVTNSFYPIDCRRCAAKRRKELSSRYPAAFKGIRV